MDVQPLSNSQVPNNGVPQPVVGTAPAPPQPQVATTAPQPVSVYPTPVSGFAAAAPLPATANANMLQGNSYGPLTKGKSLGGGLAFCLALISVGIIPLLIFVPALIKSTTFATVWLLIVSVLGTAGLVLGLKSRNNSDDLGNLSLLAIIISIVMLVFCLIIGSYYIKLEIALNSLKSTYKSNSSLYDTGL